jgi:hypothetical protein
LAEIGVRARREARRELRRVVTVAGTDTGDWLLFTIAWRNLHVLPMTLEVRAELARRLAMGSPLLSLAMLTGGSERVTTRELFERLLEPRATRMLECLDELLVSAWVQQIRDAQQIRDTARFIARFVELADAAETYLEVLDRARRLDLARAVMRLVGHLVSDLFPREGVEERRRALLHRKLGTIAERDALLAALARVVAIAERLVSMRDALAQTRYGDDRYEEAQIVLADAERLLDPHLDRVRALRVGLSGALR